MELTGRWPIWRDRPDPSLPYALQLTHIATRCGRMMVTLMEKGEKCGRGYLAVGTNLKGHPLETQLHTYTVYGKTLPIHKPSTH